MLVDRSIEVLKVIPNSVLALGLGTLVLGGVIAKNLSRDRTNVTSRALMGEWRSLDYISAAQTSIHEVQAQVIVLPMAESQVERDVLAAAE